MYGEIEKPIAEALARWVDLMRRRAGLVLSVATAVTLGVALYAATHLELNADLDRMFSEELPHRVLELERLKRFPHVDDNILIIIDGATIEQAGDAAQALAERMRAAGDVFDEVYLPRDSFFEDHALLYMETGDLDDLADRLARVQPYLAGLAKDGTLRGLANMLERAVAAVRDGDFSGAELVPMFDRFQEAISARLDDAPYRLSWAAVIAGRELDIHERRYFVIAQPVIDFSKFVAGRTVMETIDRFVDELGLRDVEGLRVRVTGDIALSYEEMTLVESQAVMAALASLLMVSVLLSLALRSARLVLATVVTLIMGLVATMGFATAAVGHVNVISIGFAVLFIGLSVDFAIHFCMRYQELIRAGSPHELALRETAHGVGSSILLCAVTTAIGFYAFVPTDFSGVAELGLIAGTGMFIGTLFCFTTLPAMISLGRGEAAAAVATATVQAESSEAPFSTRHPRRVASLAVVLGLGAVFLLPEVRFDHNPVNVRDPSAESVQALEEIIADGGDSPWDMSAVAPDLEAAEELAAKLRELDEVEQVLTVNDFVPGDQDEKLAILEDVAMFLAPAPAADGSVPAPEMEEQLEALHSLHSQLARLLRDGGDEELLNSARRLLAVLAPLLEKAATGEVGAATVATLEESLLGSLPAQLSMLERAVNVGPISIEKLPSGLLARMVSADGAALVRISPREDLNDNDALERFVTSVVGVVPEATGSARTIYENGRVAVDAFQQALVAAVVVIAILLLVIWRTFGETLLVMAPLALASVMTTAIAVLTGIPFNYADIIVLPLLLGIGVDSGIHLVHRARSTHEQGDHLLETSTAYAVLFSSLTTISSFGSLALASHRGMASLGQLLAVGVGVAVLCNLLFLPAFIELRSRWQRHGGLAPPDEGSA